MTPSLALSEYRAAVEAYRLASYAVPYDRAAHLEAGRVFEVAWVKYQENLDAPGHTLLRGCLLPTD
jgi:hypothetical protein